MYAATGSEQRAAAVVFVSIVVGRSRADEEGKKDITCVLLTKALFSSEKISDFGTLALSFVCDKYYPIID